MSFVVHMRRRRDVLVTLTASPSDTDHVTDVPISIVAAKPTGTPATGWDSASGSWNDGVWNRARWDEGRSEQRPMPPRWGELLLYFALGKKDRDPLLGDLAEDFPVVAARHGARAARVWYWLEVARAIWSHGGRRLLGVLGLGAIVRRVIAWLRSP